MVAGRRARPAPSGRDHDPVAAAVARVHLVDPRAAGARAQLLAQLLGPLGVRCRFRALPGTLTGRFPAHVPGTRLGGSSGPDSRSTLDRPRNAGSKAHAFRGRPRGAPGPPDSSI